MLNARTDRIYICRGEGQLLHHRIHGRFLQSIPLLLPWIRNMFFLCTFFLSRKLVWVAGLEPAMNFGVNEAPLPLGHTHMVGVAGFEPTIFCSQSRRDSQVTLHSDDEILIYSFLRVIFLCRHHSTFYGEPCGPDFGCCMYLKIRLVSY